MLEIDWSNADIIYASSICFPDEVRFFLHEFLFMNIQLVEGIADKCKLLKKGSRILTLKSLPEKDYLTLEYSLKIKMTWGRC